MMPALQNINLRLWQAGESQVLSSEQVIAQIQDPLVKSAAQGAITAQKEELATNIEFTGFLNQYAWVWISLIILIVLFIQIRRDTEIQRGF